MGNFVVTGNSKQLVLTGRIVTMSKNLTVLDQGHVCIDGSRIVAIVPATEQLPERFRSVPALNTRGTIYPGLVELHNHLPYNYLPLWEVPRPFTNRNIWREHEPDYDVRVNWPSRLIGKNADKDYLRSVARYVECRSLFGGVTTTQGLSFTDPTGNRYYSGLLRNVEAPNDTGLVTASGQTLDFKPAQIATDLVPALETGKPFIYHLSEGTDSDARQCFLDLEYQPNQWAIRRNLIAIHGTGLTPPDLARMKAAAGLVWSPLSNYLLYGATANFQSAIDNQVTLALGSDWSPSGSKNLLGELKIARIVNAVLRGPLRTVDLVKMVTIDPARMLGWDSEIGSIEPGKRADLLILDGASNDPYEQLIAAREDDLLAVLIDGRPRLGRQELMLIDLEHQELVRVGKQVFALDLVEAGADPLAGLSLSTATAKLSWGLTHLPELARASFNEPSALVAAPRLELNLDLTSEPVGMFSSRFADIDPDRVVPLTLEPLTSVDDTTFYQRVKANRNIPAFLKEALP